MKKILVIDDTKNIRNLLTKCLEVEGYSVKTASDGKEAIELFKSEQFDLAFLDIKIPEIRGTRVLKLVRDMGVKTPIIIITAYGTIKNAIDCTNMGAVAYMQKPFSAEKIISVIHEIDKCPQADLISPNILEIENLINDNKLEEAERLIKLVLSKETLNPDIYLLYSRVFKLMGYSQYAEKFYKIYLIMKD